jgi:cell division protease FtsH
VNHAIKTVAFWLLIVLSGVLMWKVVQSPANPNEQEITFSEFMKSVDRGDVAEVAIAGTNLRGKYKNDKVSFHTTVPANYPGIFDRLHDQGVKVRVSDSSPNTWPNYLLNISPLILFGALWFVVLRGIQRTNRRKVRFTYEAVTAPDLPRALEKANEMSREGWRAVCVSAGNSSSATVIVLIQHYRRNSSSCLFR